MGGNTQPIADKKGEIAKSDAPRAVRHLPPRRAAHRRIEQCNAPGATQAPGKLHVFHQGNGGEAAETPEDFRAYKNALIAVDRPEGKVMTTLEVLQPPQPGMPFVERPIESAADHIGICHRCDDGVEVLAGKLGIDVVKEENIGVGGGSAGVQLRPPARCRNFTPDQVFQCSGVESGDARENDLGNARMRSEEPAELDRFLDIAPAGNDERDSTGHSLTGVRGRLFVDWEHGA